jgi:hypothetical protein
MFRQDDAVHQVLELGQPLHPQLGAGALDGGGGRQLRAQAVVQGLERAGRQRGC